MVDTTRIVKSPMPMIYPRGTDDRSIMDLPPDPIMKPIHLPLFYLTTEKGRMVPEIVSYNDALRLFGEKTFQQRSKFFTHQTKLAMKVMQQGQSVMIKRVEPFSVTVQDVDNNDVEWADKTATLELKAVLAKRQFPQDDSHFLSLIPTFVLDDDTTVANPNYKPNQNGVKYQRVTDPLSKDFGKFKIGLDGNKIPELIDVVLDGANLTPDFPNLKDQQKTQAWYDDVLVWVLVEPGENPLSKLDFPVDSAEVYDIATIAADSYGAWGNRVGFELFGALSDTSVDYDQDVIAHQKAVPYVFRCYQKLTEDGAPKQRDTLDGGREVTFMFKPGGYNYKYNQDLPITDVIDKYNDDGIISGTSPVHGIVGKFDFHIQEQDGLEDLLTKLTAIEFVSRQTETFTDGTDTFSWHDFFPLMEDPNKPEDAMWYFDMFRLIDGQFNIPFVGIGSAFAGGTLTDGSIHMLTGGADGPCATEVEAQSMYDGMYYDVYDIRVEEEIRLHYDVIADNGRSLLDHARFPFSVVYDSGFDVNVKRAIPLWMGYRDDVNVTIATGICGDKPISLDDELALAADLYNNSIMVIPESEYFGTGTYRCVIMQQSGKLLNDTYIKWVPTTFELAQKRARYMGAANGKAKGPLMYTKTPLNQIQFMKQITNTYMREATRLKAWALGLNYIEYASNRTLYFPALHTVYAIGNSVLTSERFMNFVTEIKKISNIVYTQVVGRDDLTNAQFIDEWNKLMNEALVGKFHDSITVVPDCYFTPRDEALGYSWVGRTHVYGNVSKTVQQTEVLVYRND